MLTRFIHHPFSHKTFNDALLTVKRSLCKKFQALEAWALEDGSLPIWEVPQLDLRPLSVALNVSEYKRSYLGPGGSMAAARRRLSDLVSADKAVYSCLIADDEPATMETLYACL